MTHEPTGNKVWEVVFAAIIMVFLIIAGIIYMVFDNISTAIIVTLSIFIALVIADKIVGVIRFRKWKNKS